MNERDELMDLILHEFNPSKYGGSSWRLNPGAAADAIIAAGYRKDQKLEERDE